jgi:aminopeptidase
MRDPRLEEFADVLVNYSTRVAPGEHVMIEHTGEDTAELARACAEKTVAAGGIPMVVVLDQKAVADFVTGASEAQIKAHGELELELMKKMKVFIAIRGSRNVFELGSVPEDKMRLYSKYVRIPVHLEQRVRFTRWVVTRYPNESMAQNAGRPTRDFEDFYFKACLLDWEKMSAAQKPLVDLMNRTDRVRIVGKGTDISFSIKGIPAVNCSGSHNIPDGECFTAPVRDSVNGVVQFNTKTVYEGVPFQNIRLEYKDGKVVKASDDLNTVRLNEILDKDEGARYIGEFAIGFHPTIREPMLDILFDEKICGSFHMALGQCYRDETPNGNDSAIHWDMVCIQRPEYGGGKIIFDDVVIREDGVFTVPELHGLNPEHLN